MRNSMKRTVLGILLLTVVLALCAGCGEKKAEEDNKPSKREEVEAFVADAVEFARENGREKALAVFSDPNGEFTRGDLYIYAYDFNCVVIAHGGDQSLIGKDLTNYKDPNGLLVIQELRKLAEKGGGWLDYVWDNPETDKQQQKYGYVEKVDDTWWLGSGYYE